MKAVFKQNIRNMRFYIFAGCSLLVFSLAIMNRAISPLFGLLLIWVTLFLIFLRSYKITEDDVLKGNGDVSIKTIRKLVKQPNSVVVYYFPDHKDKMRIKTYYVKDKELFIKTLHEINPDIQVVWR